MRHFFVVLVIFENLPVSRSSPYHTSGFCSTHGVGVAVRPTTTMSNNPIRLQMAAKLIGRNDTKWAQGNDKLAVITPFYYHSMSTGIISWHFEKIFCNFRTFRHLHVKSNRDEMDKPVRAYLVSFRIINSDHKNWQSIGKY